MIALIKRVLFLLMLIYRCAELKKNREVVYFTLKEIVNYSLMNYRGVIADEAVSSSTWMQVSGSSKSGMTQRKH
ncbi:hypothetical protein [Neobacillus vireti]|uniref:hypothetical protein n=1 Tax=Neobacillus vireti TaxID=220686 RepID=UPI002FFFE72E